MQDIIARGALPYFIWGVIILLLSLIVALAPVMSRFIRPKKFNEEKWAKIKGKFICMNTYLGGGDYRRGTSAHDMTEFKISYQVNGKEYVKYVDYCFEDPFYIYYRVSNPGIFMLEDEYKEKVHLSKTRKKKRKEKIDIPDLLLSIFLAFWIFIAGVSLLSLSFDKHTAYDGHGGSRYVA